MKKRSAGVIIVRTFLKSIGIILLFLIVGMLSYYLTMLYYNQTDRVERSTQYTHVISVNTGNESANLIYGYDKEKQKIKAMVLELFDKTTKNLHYLTIPADTQVTISSSVYSEMLKVNQSIPQVVQIADIPQYFSGDVAYEYGIMILQEELGADIGYFTMLSSEKFDEYFEKLNRKAVTYYPSKALLDQAEKCSDAGDMEDLMEEKWDEVVSDITLDQKQNYASALVQVTRDYIRGYRAYGSRSGGVFTLNTRKNRRLINSIWEQESYTSAQSGLLLAGETASKNNADDGGMIANIGNRSIQITNGSGINGLAAAYRQKLEADGCQVLGVGNYMGGIQTRTTIYAGKKKWAKAVAGYFKDPVLCVAGSLTNNADIEIVLGTEDDLNPQ